MSIYENYPLPHFYSLMNLLGTHDTPRILSVLQNNLPNFSGSDQKRIAIQRLKLAVLWQMTYPGVPLIYYGDEAGLEGVEEPLNRRPYPWGKEMMSCSNGIKYLLVCETPTRYLLRENGFPPSLMRMFMGILEGLEMEWMFFNKSKKIIQLSS